MMPSVAGTFGALSVVVVMCCGCGTSDRVPAEPLPPAPEPADLVFAFDLDDVPDGNGALGTVFTFISADGRVECGAGFISAVSTRIFTNQNDLEFWCAEAQRPDALEWAEVQRPQEDLPTTLLANIGGTLRDYILPSWLDPQGRWNRFAAPGQAPYRGDLMTIREDARRWTFSLSALGCDGLSVYDNDAYYGTVPADASIASAIVWRGAVFANYDGKLWRADLPQEPFPEQCRMLDPILLRDDPMYVYAMLPVEDALWIGGGGQPFLDDQRYPCAPLYVTDGASVEVVELQGCEPLQVTEVYSFMYFGDGLYAGVYPDGYLYRVDDVARTATRSTLPQLQPDTWTDGERRYLESQSMTIAAGRALIGMYPWGEIYELGDSPRVYRLFSAPEKEAVAIRPFEIDDDNDWSQRVVSLVTLSGRVCAGTGNTFQAPYDPAEHPYVDPEIVREYGAVHCAPLADQVLASFRPRTQTRVAFGVTPDHLYIEQDGAVVAWRPHSLSGASLSALASGAVTVGDGRYGPARVNIIQR